MPVRISTLQVSDIAIAVREGADAVMLSGETAFGKFPFKAVEVMGTVAKKTESSMLSYSVSAMLCRVCTFICEPSRQIMSLVCHYDCSACVQLIACPTPDTLSLSMNVDNLLQQCSRMFSRACQC